MVAALVMALSMWFPHVALATTPRLARHGVLGIVPTNQQGAVVVSVVGPGSAAQRAGLRPGDVVVTVNGSAVRDSNDLIGKLHLAGGSPVSLGIRRAKTSLTKHAVLAPAPLEVSSRFTIRYSAVSVDGSLRRSIVTIPRNSGPHPAVLFIGGIGCYSIDNVPLGSDPYRHLAYDLTRAGFETMRLEKSGIGDSQGPPCPTVDFAHETHSYALALEALRGLDEVDARRVYLFGHSIGTLIAPRLALEHPVAGIVASEGVASNWFEYELINTRRQLPLAGLAAPAIETELQHKEYCMHRLLIEEVAPARLVRDRDWCAQYVEYPVALAYMRQLVRLNLATPWMSLSAPVLAIYGSSDFETDEEDHRQIVALVNSGHPGHGSLRIIPKMDHFLAHAVSPFASFRRVGAQQSGEYDEEFSRAVVAWLRARGT